MMSALVHAEIDGQRLDDDAILQESLLILVGGDETTRHVITGGMEALLRHPTEQREARRRTRRSIPTAVEEMLRWVTPIQNMNRTGDARRRARRARASAPATRCCCSTRPANRDERVFPHAPTSSTSTASRTSTSRSATARHFCLGASLARLELRVHVRDAARRGCRDIELRPARAPLRRRPSNFIVGIATMPVAFAAR